MAEQEKREFVVGTLKAELKVFKDKETGESREYYGYSISFPNGAKVRFTPLQDDRALLNFLLADKKG